MNNDYIIVGVGGHASVITDILLKQNKKIIAYVTDQQHSSHINLENIELIKSDEEAISKFFGKVNFINGIGSIPGNNNRKEICKLYEKRNIKFGSVISETASLAQDINLSNGVQIFPGAIINPGATIKANSIINSGAIVEHDCNIGSYNHVSPGARICGNVTVGNNTHIGAGAVIIQNLFIGNNSIIGAGSVITQDIASNMIVFPSKSTIKNKGKKYES
jgi:sugar O-acyltransferase (sialic acid O-acetyltransferase NeuD family)